MVELISADGTSGLTHKAALQAAGLDAPVIVSSDAEVRGYGEHGFAAAIRRPYVAEEVRRVVEEALPPEGRDNGSGPGGPGIEKEALPTRVRGEGLFTTESLD